MTEQNPIVSTLHELGPWVLSFIAIAQLWVVKAIEKLRRGTVEIFESKAIEVSHGTLGPSIGVLGTLRAVTKEFFVRKMHASIQRDRDQAMLSLSWWAFRSAAAGGRNLEPVFGFLISPSEPFRYDLFLVDAAFVASVKGRLEALGQRWREFIRDQIAKLPQGSRVALAENPGLSEALFSEFLKDPDAMDLFKDLDRRNYWENDGYSLCLTVTGADNRTFSKKWRFRLSDDDKKRLQTNAICAVREICGLPPGCIRVSRI